MGEDGGAERGDLGGVGEGCGVDGDGDGLFGESEGEGEGWRDGWGCCFGHYFDRRGGCEVVGLSEFEIWIIEARNGVDLFVLETRPNRNLYLYK